MIYTSKHSKKSAIALGEALNCGVQDIYQRVTLRLGGKYRGNIVYNMGTTAISNGMNDPVQIGYCVNKLFTFQVLEANGVRVPPYTVNFNTAQGWLNEDKMLVNRMTLTGKANEGLEYSYKGAIGINDVPLRRDAKMWTRYVNHNRELRAYCFQHEEPLVFEKVLTEQNEWAFSKVRVPAGLKAELRKAMQAFNNMRMVAFDILDCVTGDLYFLEANSAPSLLVHNSIIPQLVKEINHG